MKFKLCYGFFHVHLEPGRWAYSLGVSASCSTPLSRHLANSTDHFRLKPLLSNEMKIKSHHPFCILFRHFWMWFIKVLNAANLHAFNYSIAVDWAVINRLKTLTKLRRFVHSMALLRNGTNLMENPR